ncbi:Snf7-domain-containing protein [Phanerochaete sordida]|uniref:Snf7-domain-containing protein n=1 Tax=Phanerochaete sordida TaxID=48140 RepID=A0A9P3G2D7_9APHY|nr:Snf7-domain-containing protein [Phanerochaete sordida]
MSSPGPSSPRLQSLPTYQGTTPSRLKFLYSDFSGQKHANPGSFASNVDWWRRTLAACVARGWQGPDRLVLHAAGPALTEAFRAEGVGRPLALATVIAELTAAKACVPLAPFLSAVQPIRDPGSLPYRLAAYVVGRPLWWALQQAGVVASDESFGAAGDAERWRRAKGDYVVVDLVERAADAVVAGQEARGGVNVADAVYSFEGFKKTFASEAIEGVTLSDLDLKVLLKYLERDKKVIVRQGDVIKFTQGAATPEITAVDIGVLELKTAIENLEAAIEHIHKQIDDRTAKASAALTQKRKETALSHLRARKQYEDLLAKRLAALDTLHGTLLAVERAAGDVALLHAYAGSTATLRGILAHPALRLERLDATTDAMAAAQADARDIDERIRLGADLALADAGVDDAELESELSALVAEAEGEKAAKVKAEEEEMLRRMEALKTPSHTPPAEAQEEQAKVPEHA